MEAHYVSVLHFIADESEKNDVTALLHQVLGCTLPSLFGTSMLMEDVRRADDDDHFLCCIIFQLQHCHMR